MDHPRACGEKDKAKEMGATTKGSPPHVRGKAHVIADRVDVAGITPACAGKSHWESLRRSPPEDHPRVCGEKDKSRVKVIPSQGSPPRVRGKENHAGLWAKSNWITPACAGKSFGCCCSYSVRRDHPRVCGEKASARAFS